MLSVLVWRHMNSTFAVGFEAGRTLWRRAHTNRIDLDPVSLLFFFSSSHASHTAANCLGLKDRLANVLST